MYNDNYDSSKEKYLISLRDYSLDCEMIVYAEGRDEMAHIMVLLSARYEVLNIDVLDNIMKGRDFIEDLKINAKPDNLEFGVDDTDHNNLL